jgi:hypothetical protein
LFFYPPDGGYNNVIPPGFKTSFACLSALEPALSIAKGEKNCTSSAAYFNSLWGKLMCIDKGLKRRGYPVAKMELVLSS